MPIPTRLKFKSDIEKEKAEAAGSPPSKPKEAAKQTATTSNPLPPSRPDKKARAPKYTSEHLKEKSMSHRSLIDDESLPSEAKNQHGEKEK